MKYLLTTAAIFALAGCTTAQLSSTLNTSEAFVAQGCSIVQPTIAGVAPKAGNADLSTAVDVNGVFCAATEAAVAARATPASAPAAMPASAPAAMPASAPAAQ